ncbi:hypothetical protein AYO20_08440 [Fonsecaea nubica]|uniref:Methyltransferase domain-containing protein n=1 Tax=Fonsecaea nubica TaxID=856822 RepID=A0A178CMH7_9EURO|nr:hypothetical protein AYO20_08440 [Fonsecaea nubica]OAL31019.1 hypothetical protein AYO20_08440 [Fonsecaea nubica]
MEHARFRGSFRNGSLKRMRPEPIDGSPKNLEMEPLSWEQDGVLTGGSSDEGPSDEQQFETLNAGHVLYLVLDSNQPNPLFRSPVKEPLHVLDIGTGPGTWAIRPISCWWVNMKQVSVVHRLTNPATVYGVDLSPPPSNWVPPNCFLQVDDVLEEWTWRQDFDLIHMRLMLGAFTDTEWTAVYKKCFDNLRSGGYIEQVELDVRVMSDDGSLAPDSLLAGWGQTFLDCARRAGRPLDTQLTMKAKIEAAGFVDVQEHLYKCPIGAWPKDPLLKDAGRINLTHWSSGLDGWAMMLLTRWGAPEPWTADEARVYVARVREELKKRRLHIWHYT